MKQIGAMVGVVVVLAGLVVGYRYYLVHQLRGQVLAQLNDPESAQFRGERYAGPWMATKGTLCGQVNARNRMGGYVGYRSFSATAQEALVLETPEEFNCRLLVDDESLPWWWLRW